MFADEYLGNIDMFSFPITLRYKNSMFFRTRSGICVSTIIYIISLWIVVGNVQKAMRNSPETYEKKVTNLFPDTTNQDIPIKGGPSLFLAYDLRYSNGSKFISDPTSVEIDYV